MYAKVIRRNLSADLVNAEAYHVPKKSEYNPRNTPHHGQRFWFLQSNNGPRQRHGPLSRLCRGDVNLDSCQTCLNNSIVRLGQLCPNQKEAIGYYDNCLVKYSNEVILRSRRIKFYVGLANSQNATDINRFNGALGPLLSRLRGEAAGGNELLKFASDSTNETNFSSIYGLVQCTPDLSQQQCVR
ncbi:hypothetical protein E3N88_04594 [Mikania micrantha]|uniref:Gnk2-homologous domain-containing protein n=1 Tax=Mikania micrantha TaxID=192012 RepID=A0A5N6PWP7_9ASTR|nr:hypothetical protein E3N88_04594 [Mikania micrantha]